MAPKEEKSWDFEMFSEGFSKVHIAKTLCVSRRFVYK
jgi:hypothetical protein